MNKFYILLVICIIIFTPFSMLVKGQGNVGIGTATPQSKLDIDGDVRAAYGASNNFESWEYLGTMSGGSSDMADHVILLCRTGSDVSGTTNSVFGEIYGKRVSGNRTSGILKVTLNQTSSGVPYGILHGTLTQSMNTARLVTCTYNGEEYVAIEFQSNNWQGWTNGVWFRGNASSSGERLAIRLRSEVSNINPNGVNVSDSRFFVSGRTGIGTTSPEAQLHVDGSVRFEGLSSGSQNNALMIDNNGNLSTRNMNVNNWDEAYGWGNHATAGYLTSFDELDPTWSGTPNTTSNIGRSGNVGIGTTSPSTRLQVHGGGSGYPTTTSRGGAQAFLTNNNQGIEFGTASGSNDRRSWILARHSNAASFGQHMSTLHLQPRLTGSPSVNYFGVAIGIDPSIKTPQNRYLHVGGESVFEENVGIGTTNPDYRLHVTQSNTSENTAVGIFENTSNDGAAGGFLHQSTISGYSAAEGVINNISSTYAPTGLFGLGLYNGINAVRNIGTSGHVNNWRGIGVLGSRTDNGGLNDGWGGLFLADLGYTGGVYNASDIQLKKNITSISRVMEKVMRLRPVQYEYNTEKYPYMGLNTNKEFGFIAQEVAEIFPNITASKYLPADGTKPIESLDAQVNREEKVLMMDYTRIIPLLTKAIQEQQELILELQNKIDELYSR